MQKKLNIIMYIYSLFILCYELNILIVERFLKPKRCGRSSEPKKTYGGKNDDNISSIPGEQENDDSAFTLKKVAAVALL